MCFVVCFVLALFTVFLPVQWRSWLPGSEEKSMIDGVRSAVYSFMSYLT
ncbi:MAG: light-harvesting protein [Betaproteobacteria bacterium]|nr:light-harvesting protein [Betaproteobacteria bacterium]